jgi:tRNA(fMet)-specific endonuclease VapC
VRFILDTNIVSAFMRGDPRVVDEVASVRVLDVGIPQPVLAEIAYGIQRLPRSKKRLKLERDFERIERTFPRAGWSDEVSRLFGAAKAALEGAGDSVEDFDVAIAAHALAEQAVLVTDNLDHFERVEGLEIENWLDHH